MAQQQAWLAPPSVLLNSPSREDGFSEAEERSLRHSTSLFIEECAKELRLPKVAAATALVFFHRFYALQSFRRQNRYNIAVTCIFLASKVEESSKKLNEVILACDAQWRSKSPDGSTATEKALEPESAEYEKCRLHILQCERIVLHTISFDLFVEHPYKFLIESVKALNHSGLVAEAVKKDFAQRAVAFLNDSLRTSLCLQHPPQKLASAAIYLAVCFLNVPVNPSQAHKWDERLAITADELASISRQILAQYEEDVANDPQKRDLEARLVARGVLEPQRTRSHAPPDHRGNTSGSGGGDDLNLRPPSPKRARSGDIGGEFYR